MISLEKLRVVKHVICHQNCPDGYASALVLKDALPDVRVSFVSYGTEEHLNFTAEPGQIWCDFSPPKFRAAEFVAAGAIVMDHHSRDVVEPYGELGIFGENAKLECGAMLAFLHVWRRIRNPGPIGAPMGGDEKENQIFHFAQLCAVRDTWKRDDPRFQRARDVGELLFFWHTKLRLSHYLDLPPGPLPLAERLFERAEELACKSIDEAHRFTTSKGTRVLLFQGVSATSDAAELLEKDPYLDGSGDRHPPDIVAGFHYRVDWDKNEHRNVDAKLQLQFSCRSHTGYDVSALAKAHGGGGHRAAAGFTVEVSPEIGGNPYAIFRILLEQHEE